MNFLSNVRLKGIKSIMLTIAVILLCCSLMFGYILMMLRDNMMQTGNDLMHYLQRSVDSRLLEIQKYSTVLELHPANSVLKRAENNGEFQVTADMYRFSDQILNFKLANRLVDGVFLYYPNSNLIVGNLGCYPAYSYYALDNRLLIDGYEQWLSGINGAANELVLLNADGRQRFCYVRRMMYEGETKGYIVFQLNTEELLGATNEIVLQDPRRFAFGITLDGELFTQTGNPELFNGAEMGEAPTTTDTVVEEDLYSLRYLRKSQFPNLYYLTAYVQREYMRPLLIALYICIAGVLLCVLFGLAAAIYISKQNAKPMQNLLTKLGILPSAEQDAYQVISSRLDQMMREHNISVEKLQEQQTVIGSLFLNMVLTGNLQNEYAIFSAAKRYDVLLENPYYLIAVVSLPGGAGDNCPSEVLRWCEDAGYDVVVSIQQGRVIILFNPEEEMQQEHLVPILERLLATLFPTATAALGLRFDSLVNISVSYTQALTALRQTSQNGQVICYNDHMDDGAPTSAAAPSEELGSTAERAREIIDRTFTDPMLGLYMISDELGISNSYLSTTFKNKFGIGVVQYINQLRIEQAKNLICHTDMSIKDIAVAVGFSGDISFIRVFKRYESQTPTMLRRLHSAERTN